MQLPRPDDVVCACGEDALAGRIHGQGTHRCSVARHDELTPALAEMVPRAHVPVRGPCKEARLVGGHNGAMTGPAWPLRRRAQPSPSPTSPVRASLASITRRASARPAARTLAQPRRAVSFAASRSATRFFNFLRLRIFRGWRVRLGLRALSLERAELLELRKEHRERHWHPRGRTRAGRRHREAKIFVGNVRKYDIL